MSESGMHIECVIDKDDFNAAGEASSKVKKSQYAGRFAESDKTYSGSDV